MEAIFEGAMDAFEDKPEPKPEPEKKKRSNVIEWAIIRWNLTNKKNTLQPVYANIAIQDAGY